MSDPKINLVELREVARMDHLPDEKNIRIESPVLLAIITVVEAAQRVAELPSAVVNSGAHELLRATLVRFDFGDSETSA